jgi:hypothetical protein
MVFVSIYFPVCYLSLAIWALFGSNLQFLNRIKNGIKAFNVISGGLLISIAAYLIFTAHA